MSALAGAVLPLIILLIIGFASYKRVPVFDTFLEGAKEGLLVSLRILPALVGLLCAIAMLEASGGLALVVRLFSPAGALLGLPAELTPLALLRPISGSGSLALVSGVFEQFGVDSSLGLAASVMMGSTETTLYTIAIYFSAIGVQKTRYCLKTALIADGVSFAASVFFVHLFLL